MTGPVTTHGDTPASRWDPEEGWDAPGGREPAVRSLASRGWVPVFPRFWVFPQGHAALQLVPMKKPGISPGFAAASGGARITSAGAAGR